MSSREQSAFEEETMSMVEAMQKQEKAYACQDYCRLHADKTQARTLESDRKLMLKWSYNVIDYFNLNRETASIALNYSDRFLQSSKGPEFLDDTDMYQLLCITSLYLAIKVHESASITPRVFVNISHGSITANQLETMETILLSTLGWRINPPTSLGWARMYLELLSNDLDPSMRASAYTLAKTQIERAVGDYKLLTTPPSQIAYASVVNAVEAIGGSLVNLPHHLFSDDFLQNHFHPLRIKVSSAISWEAKFMSIVPTAASKKATTAKNRSRNDSEESTTPRSVLCYASGRAVSN